MEPTIRHIDRNSVFATFDRALLQVWRGDTTAQSVTKLLEIGRALVVEQRPHRCSSLSIVESSSPPPGQHVRPLISACFRELAPHMHHQLFVAEGSGFRSALVRGVGLAVSTFAPSLLSFTFASNITEAAALIAPTLSANANTPAAVIDAVAFVRRALDAHSAG